MQQSIDMFYPPGPQQQTCSAAAAVCCCRPMLGQTDGRTDGHGTVVQTMFGTLCGQYQQITCKRRRTVCRLDVISRTVITRAIRQLTSRSIYARNENDNFCIYRRPCTRHKTNAEVRAVSGCPPLSNMVSERRLGHIARSAPNEDHHRTVAAAIRKPPSDWKRPPLQEDPTTRGSEPLNRI